MNIAKYNLQWTINGYRRVAFMASNMSSPRPHKIILAIFAAAFNSWTKSISSSEQVERALS
jgi:hypothetical protein